MKKPVMLRIQGRQYYGEQEPEVIELMTEGTLEFVNGGWDICYEESELTGLAGTTTTFRLEPGKVHLIRTGALRSEMVFQEGVRHQSLYRMDFGALLLTVCARQIMASISDEGGIIDLIYDVEIEHAQAGVVEYHLEIQPQK